MAPGIAAAKAGRTVIFAPNPPLYVNYANSSFRKNPRAYSAHTSYLNQAHFVYPDTPAIPAASRSLVLGAEVGRWGECVTGAQYMFTHVFPRACALAENLWTPRAKLDWPGFTARLDLADRRFEAMSIPYFWEPETLALNIGSWGLEEAASKKGLMEFPLERKLRQVGEQEFFVAQTVGEGQFRIDAVELIKDGVVVDTDRHRHESSVYRNADSLYVAKQPDLAGKYSVRIHVDPLFGDCGAIVQLIPALAPNQYSKQCAPGTGANRTKQTPAP